MTWQKPSNQRRLSRLYLNKKIVVIFLIIAVLILIGAVMLASYAPLSGTWSIGLGLVLGGLCAGGGYVYVLESNSNSKS